MKYFYSRVFLHGGGSVEDVKILFLTELEAG